MQKFISQVLVVGGDASFRHQAVCALERTRTQIIFTSDVHTAVEEVSKNNQLPGLVISDLEYKDPQEPLELYHFLRANPKTCSTPFLYVVGTDFEVGLIKSMKLEHAFAMRAPLTFASLIFALPALELQINGSLLYQRKAAFEVETSLAPIDTGRPENRL